MEYGSLYYACKDGLAYWVVIKNEKSGVLDVEGKEVFYSDYHIPLIGLRPTYDHRSSSKDSEPYYFYVLEGGKEGLFGLNGIEICPVKYKNCWLRITNNGLELYKDDITQKISYNGETKFNYQPLDQLVEPQNPLYDWDLGNGLYSKYEGDYVVLLDAHQNYLEQASYKYKNVSCLNGDEGVWCLKVSKNKEGGPYGIVDKKGTEIIPPELDEIEKLDGNFLKFKINGFWGVMNYQGKTIIPTSRGYTNIGRYIKSQKRFTYEMYGYRGECNHLGQQVSKIKVATEPQQQNSVANNPTTRPSNTQSQNTTTTQQPQKQVIVVEQQRQPVPVQEWVQCNICHNSGTCQVCYGNGYTGFGTTSSVCVSCNGRKVCSYCAGQGGHYETRYR